MAQKGFKKLLSRKIYTKYWQEDENHMEKTDKFNGEMCDYFSAEKGAYTFFTTVEINKGTFTVKAVIRDMIVEFLGNKNIPVANVTDNQEIVFSLYDPVSKTIGKKEKIPCKYSKAKAGKKEMSIYFSQRLLSGYQVSAGDIWFVFFTDENTYPVLGMMQRKKWLLEFSENREFYLKKHITDFYINTIHLMNYRCFKDTEVKLDKDYTVLVGINGTGKTSVLDSVATGISGFLNGFDGVDIKNFSKDDARISTQTAGVRVQTMPNYPVGIEVTATVDGYKLAWRRIINKEAGKVSSNKDAIIETLAYMMQESIKTGNKDVCLPVIAYYGTDRLRNINISKAVASVTQRTENRFDGYDRCLSSAIDYKMFNIWFEEMTLLELQTGEKIPELEVVRTAIQDSYKILTEENEACKIDYNLKSKEIEITRAVDKNTEQVPIRLLSDGMKSVLVMVGDIAYRMARLNPDLQDSIIDLTPGVIIIDEIDMHLHPSWQKNIIKTITTVFPKIQLITTTHAPSVLTNINKDHLVVLSDYEIYYYTNEFYGRTVDEVLSQVMGTDVRPDEIKELLNSFSNKLEENLEEAETILGKLERLLGSTAKEVVSGRVCLDVEKELKKDDID